jgi:hypothetical protein
VAAIAESVRGEVRHRYDDFVEEWEQGQRHLPYTILAVMAILLMGAIIVPITVSATRIEPTPEREILAARYVDAVAAVRGSTEAVPSVRKVAKSFGTTGGDACTKPIPALSRDLVVRPKGRASFVDRAAVERAFVVMSVYCPGREDRYQAWTRAAARG